MKGLIFNIERFSVHDGPGIRTLIFLKGCPLRCKWCSNPESWNPKPEVIIHKDRMKASQNILNSLPDESMSPEEWREKKRQLHKKHNFSIGEETRAVEQIGNYYICEEVVKEVLRDEIFFKNSGGGVTLTGGEPLLQKEFVIDLLSRLRDSYVHTAIETTGFCEWKYAKPVFDLCDLILYDIKYVNSEIHRRHTGQSNALILNNFKKVSCSRYNVIPRIPLVPEYTLTETNISSIISFLKNFKHIKRVDLLPYHRLGEKKYELLGLQYNLSKVEHTPVERLQRIQQTFEKEGFTASIGGLR